MKHLHIMILVIMLVAIAIIVACALLNVSHTPKIPPVSVLPGEGQPCPQGNCQKGLVCKSKDSDESGVTVCQYPNIKPNPPRPKRHHSASSGLAKFLNGKGKVCLDNTNPKQCYNELKNTSGVLNIPSYMDTHKNMSCPSGRPGVKPEFHDILYQEGDQNVIFSCKYPGSGPGECELLQNNIGIQCPSYIQLSDQDQATSTAVWCGGVDQGGPNTKTGKCDDMNGIKQYVADSQGVLKQVCCTCPRWPCVPGAPKSFLPSSSCPKSMKECPKPGN